MIALTSPLVWYAARATGVVALVLLTGTVVLGLLTSARAGTSAVPRFAVSEVHRRVSLLAATFVSVHVVAVAVDTFVPVGWVPVVLPFVARYRALWVGLGTIALELLVAVAVSSLLRPRLPSRWWRGVHWLAYACWPVAVAHAVGTGTDVRFGWMQSVVGACCGTVAVALVWRIGAHPRRGGLLTAAPSAARTHQPPAAAAGPGRRR